MQPGAGKPVCIGFAYKLSMLSPDYVFTPLAVLYSACKVGDLDTVRDLLPSIPEAVNEFLQGGINLLMW